MSDFGGATLATQTESRLECHERLANNDKTLFFIPYDRYINLNQLPKKSHDIFSLGATMFATFIRIKTSVVLPFWEICKDPFTVDTYLFEEILSIKNKGSEIYMQEEKAMKYLRKIIKKCSVLKGSFGENDRPKINDVKIYLEKAIDNIENYSTIVSGEIRRLENLLIVETIAYDNTWVNISEVI